MSGRLPRPIRAALLLAAVTAAAGCVTPREDADRATIVAALQGNGIAQSDAECIADELIERFGNDQDTLNDIRDAQEVEDLNPDVAAAVEEALQTCQGPG